MYYVSANGKISYHIQVHLRGGSRLQCLCLHPGDCTARSTDQLVDVTQRQQDGYITAPQSPVSQCCVRKEVLAWRGVQWLRSHVPIADEGGYTPFPYELFSSVSAGGTQQYCDCQVNTGILGFRTNTGLEECSVSLGLREQSCYITNLVQFCHTEDLSKHLLHAFFIKDYF